MTDLTSFALDLALDTKAFVADYVGKALAGLSDRFAALEQQITAVKELRAVPGPAGERGPEGPAGRDAAEPDLVRIKADVRAEMLDALRADMLAMMRDLVREEVDRRMAGVAMPRDGRDGKDADLTMVKALIDATSVGRVGKDGRDGIDGKDGAPGLNGRDGAPGLDGKDGTSVSLDDLRPAIVAEVAKAFAASPPRDGKDGRDGADGKDGAPGRDGVDGKDGRDGQPGQPGPMGPQGEKGLDGKDGLNGINGKDGSPGINGKDGTTFEGFDVTFDREKGHVLKVMQGGQSQEFPLHVPFYDGIWQYGQYVRGLMKSWNGSIWHAERDIKGEKPGDGTGAWRLAVKSGRDAKPQPPRD